MPSSNTGRLHAILLIRNHSFFGRRTPAHGSGLRRSGPTSKRSGCPRPNRRHVFLQRQRQERGSFTYPAAVTSTARPARCVSNPRKRPAATDTNPANAVWPARADRLWKLAGVLGRSPDKGRPRFSSSPNLPARPLPAKPFMRIALFAAFSGAACLWIRHFKADPKRPPLAVPLSG